MRVAFAHPEPIDPDKARWVAIVRSLAAVSNIVPVTWFTPDSATRIREYALAHLKLNLPDALNIKALPSLHKRMGLTINRVFFRTFQKSIASANADVLWLRSDKLSAHVAHKLPNVAPMVYEAHLIGELYAQDKGGASRKMRRAAELEGDIYRHASAVAGITQGLVDEIRARFGYDGPTAVVPSAVDTRIFTPVWTPGESDTVVYVGTFQFWKGLDVLLEAIAKTSLRLKIVGAGKPEEEAKLRTRIDELGVTSRVEMTGSVAQPDIPLHVKGAACAVHPLPPRHTISSRFTSPLKVFEYMAIGVPIVAADVPSIREVLTDGRNARLFQPGSADALSNALNEVTSNAELAARLSKAAVADATAHTYERRATRLVELFGQAVAQRRRYD